MKVQTIPCAFYDELEAMATKKQKVTIIFLDPHDTKTMINGTITDFFVRDKVEYLHLHSGWDIPLNRIVSAGKKNLSDYSSS